MHLFTYVPLYSGRTIRSFEILPISFRLANALHSLIFYLKKMLCPFELVPFYPLYKQISLLDSRHLISGILVLAITGGCLWTVKRGNYLFFTTWFYYLITLLPVLGFIQVGRQRAADRYTYLPTISFFLLAGIGIAWIWGEIALLNNRKFFRGLLAFCVAMLMLLLSYLTIQQIEVWKNSEILWSYAIRAYPEKIQVAHYKLGKFYYDKGKLDEAISEFKQAIALGPHKDIHNNLGICYGKKGKLDEAISEFKKALAIYPNYAEAHNNLSFAYYQKGNYKLAIVHCNKAVKLGYTLNPKLLELLKPCR